LRIGVGRAPRYAPQATAPPEASEGSRVETSRFACKSLSLTASNSRAREPDVILVDALMPGMDGFEVIRAIRRAGSAAKAIVLSGGEPVEMSEAALAARADAYVPNAAAHTFLLDVIHRLADDETAAA
jgi:DNA-binding NarL/FixJ family response regulator